MDVAMDAYPLVKSLKAGPVASLGTKVVSLAATGDPKEIIQTIDAGLDAFLSCVRNKVVWLIPMERGPWHLFCPRTFGMRAVC